jgi:hypothetical protein
VSEAIADSIPRPLSVALLLIVCLVAGVIGLRDATLPIPLLLDGHVVDDFFYYLQVAWNARELGVPSLDGVQPTNGFHPLFMAILWVLQPMAGGDKALFVQQALCVLLLAHVSAAFGLGLVGRRLVGGPAATLAPAVLWLAWPWTRGLHLTGMEAPLLAAGMATSLVCWLRLDGRPSRDLALGASLAFTALARTDAIFLWGIVNVALVVQLHRRGGSSLREGMRRLLWLNAVPVVLVGVYLAANLQAFGHLMPISGRVKVARTLGQHWDPEMSPFMRIALSSRANLLLKKSVAARRFHLATVGLLGLLLIEFAAWRSTRRNEQRGKASAVGRSLSLLSIPEMRPWLLYAVVVHVYYLTVQGYFDSVWYLVHSAVIFALAGGCWVARATFGHRRAVAIGIALACCAWLTVDAIVHPPAPREVPRPARFLYDVARWMNDHLPDDARVGSYNAGTLAYFSHRPVTNLDGVINNASGEAILRRELGAYVAAEGLDYLADFEGSIHFSTVFARDNYVERLYAAEIDFGNPTTWKGGGTFRILRRRVDVDS